MFSKVAWNDGDEGLGWVSFEKPPLQKEEKAVKGQISLCYSSDMESKLN